MLLMETGCGQIPAPLTNRIDKRRPPAFQDIRIRFWEAHITATMAGSQLKRLKSTLKDQGIIGPQKSKKQRKQLAQDERARNDKRLQRGVVLEGIREQFNPFDLKHAARPAKHDVTTNRPATGKAARGIMGNPGQSKATGEERRRQTLLLEMQRRNKVGGILDRRFGENDPNMAEEDKMLERFAREKQRSHKKSSIFDLEEDVGVPFEGLMHNGKKLTFGEEEPVDDFDEADLDDGNDSDVSVRESQRRKRIRAMSGAVDDDEQAEPEQPERKKTKKEVMEEVIAKSKMHKYERQAAKEEDEDLRAQLDKELPNITSLLASSNPRHHDPTASSATIAGVDRNAFERNFDLEIKKLAQDRRAQPAERTKTDEERAEEEAEQLKELEEKRQRRMRGEEVTDSEEEAKSEPDESPDAVDGVFVEEEPEDFGLGKGIKTRPTATELGFDDEDDFIIDDDLVASGSDIEVSSDEDGEEGESGSEDEAAEEDEEEEEDDFVKGLLNDEESKNPIFGPDATIAATAKERSDDQGLPFTFPCPASCADLQSLAAKYPPKTLPTIVQRIRALYHPKLDHKNKERLANFSIALVDFIASPWDPESSPDFAVLENIIRHIHSLTKSYALEISTQFRHHLKEMAKMRPLALEPADLIVLTAIGSIFPTSDHFHQVVTPAMLTMGRYLGQKVPQKLSDYATGTYVSILVLQYQDFSKRYAPEVLNFTLNTILALAPTTTASPIGNFPVHAPASGCRISGAQTAALRRLSFEDCIASELGAKDTKSLQVAILDTSVQVCSTAADIWVGKDAFQETFSQVVSVFAHLSTKSNRKQLPSALTDRVEKTQAKLERMTRLAQISRRPLKLHNHRPLAIKTFIPKFEETYDPDKHYDPDKDRAELAKLQKEHKRERKGALRELRKDTRFMAREKLRIKKAKDEAYEKKYKRLVAEIQSEEGKEANAYERERSARKRAKDRQSN
ncbi:nop14-like family protein [Sarocladium implicatum]|nr:nop14-like family protein [Sarocladium implicatum]